jgi:DNA polymerase III subunit epsilon
MPCIEARAGPMSVPVEPGFAVVDVETTGLRPSSDRIVEISVVHVDPNAVTTGEFESLINPQRDVGPTRVHGITATDVLNAPTFADLAAEIWKRLAGRVLVAHNATFDLRFLQAEFGRCGVTLPWSPVICTMQLAGYYLPDLPARSLVACCNAAGVELSHHHSALHDARAAAGLFARYRWAHQALPGSWQRALVAAATAAWPPPPQSAEFHLVTRHRQSLRRASEPARLASVVDRLPRGTAGDSDAYLAALDRVLEDRLVSEDEAADLATLAAELGVSRDAAEQAHRRYLRHVAAAAWRDNIVTDGERADLLAVAKLLGIPSNEALLILDDVRSSGSKEAFSLVRRMAGAQPHLTAGDRVVFTGDTRLGRERLEAMAATAGLRVTKSVSGKTAVLVAADPCSQSGKARAARERGARIVTEQVFLYLLDSMIGDHADGAAGNGQAGPCKADHVPNVEAAVRRVAPAGASPSGSSDRGCQPSWAGSGQASPRQAPPPAWYPDPLDQRCWRWWDGTTWTQHVR